MFPYNHRNMKHFLPEQAERPECHRNANNNVYELFQLNYNYSALTAEIRSCSMPLTILIDC